MELMYKWITALLLTGVLLAGCGDDEQNKAANSASDGEPADTSTQDTHTPADDPSVNEDLDGDHKADTKNGKAPIEEADNVPADERIAILTVLDKQVESFNNKDIDAYMSTISKTPESFDYEEEKAYVQKVFDTFDASMTPINPTIIKYDEKTETANVFMNMESTSKDLSTGKEVSHTTRQIMVMKKEADGWKQISLFGME